MQCISYNCPIVNDMWAEIDRLREKYNAVVTERGEDHSVTQRDIKDLVAFYDSKAPDERLNEVTEIYLSYKQGDDRTNNLYAKSGINPSTFRGIVCGTNSLSMEQYLRIVAVGHKRDNPDPPSKVKRGRPQKKTDEEKRSEKQAYQHDYYQKVLKQRRKQRKEQANAKQANLPS